MSTKMIFMLICSLISPLLQAREWKLIGPHAGSIARIIADRRNPQVFYLATGDRFYYRKLYRSENGGGSWHPLPIRTITDFALHPDTSALFVIGSMPNKDTIGYHNSLLYSRDGGVSFAVRAADVPELHRIFLDPFDENRLFGFSSTLLVSSNGGRAWNNADDFPYKTGDKLPASLGGCKATNYSLADLIVSPASGSRVFLSAYIHSNCGRIEHTSPILLGSRNGGQTWRVIENKNYAFYWDPYFRDRVFATNEQGIKVLQGDTWMALSGTSLDLIVQFPPSKKLLLGLRRKYYNLPGQLFLSNDSGKTWTRANDPLDGSLFTVATSLDGTLIAGTSGAGAFRKRPGAEWREASDGLHEPLFIQIAQNKSGSQAYSLVDERYAFRTTDASPSWKALISSLGIIGRHFRATIFADPKEARTVMLDFDYGPFLISQDFGESWQSLGPHFSYPVFDAHNSNIVYLTGSGSVWKSVEGGLNATRLPLKFDKPHIKTVIDPNDPLTLYFLSNKIFKSTDGGHTMRVLTSQFRYANTMVALPEPNSFLLPYEKLYKTNDGGVNWIAISDMSSIRKIAVASGSHLFALSYDAFLESTDGGKSWTNISAEFGRDFIGERPHQSFTDIGDARGRYFYVATTKGVFVIAKNKSWRLRG